MDKEEFNLEEKYDELKQKYSLPELQKLSEDFDIEKTQEKESPFLLREIRRTINEKIGAYIHLFETLINPTSPPMFVFSLLRNINSDDKESIKEIYKTLSKTQIEIMKLDTIYKEESEAKFINETFKIWQTLKSKIYKIIENLESSYEEDDTIKNKSYFD
ncbi:MAG: hypothetical protein KJ592_04535 [Nanoarchaeota archaeon]|nr:hypothetical protein [Nanoarchaeota archaeon]